MHNLQINAYVCTTHMYFVKQFPFQIFHSLATIDLKLCIFWVYLSNVPVVVDVIDNLNILGGKIIKVVNKRVFRYS